MNSRFNCAGEQRAGNNNMNLITLLIVVRNAIRNKSGTSIGRSEQLWSNPNIKLFDEIIVRL